MIVSFEGLCAFQDSFESVKVLLPDFHSHKAAMVGLADDVDLAAGTWNPDLMFTVGGQMAYMWLLEGHQLALGDGNNAPTWVNGPAADLIIDLTKKHERPAFRSSAGHASVALHGGTLAPDKTSLNCFVFTNGDDAGRTQEFAEFITWHAPSAPRHVIRSGSKEVVLDSPDARFTISNTRPELGQLSHHFHGYYHLMQLMEGENPLTLEFSKGCINITNPRMGNCTPAARIPA